MPHVALTGRFAQAVSYALVTHAAQVRTGTEVPYASHLLAVAALTLEAGGSEAQATAAVLHDVVEDGGGRRRLEDVRAVFGDDVAALVASLSDSGVEPGGVRPPWRARKQAYLAHLAVLVESDHPAALVALCDKLHNARCIVADATDPDGPGSRVWERFSAGASGTAWYYASLAAVLAAGRLPARQVGEFESCVAQLCRYANAAEEPSDRSSR